MSQFLKMLPAPCFLFPPFVKNNTSSITKQIGIPILSPTDTPIPCFNPSNTPFSLVVGSGETFQIVALDQVRSHIGEDLQKLLEALTGFLIFCAFSDFLSEVLPPSIKASAYLFIGYTPFILFILFLLSVFLLLLRMPLLRPRAIQHGLSFQDPLSHSSPVLDLLSPTLPLFHYLLQTIQFLLTYLTYWTPFFSISSRLVATSSKASNASTPA